MNAATREETPILRPEGKVKAMWASVDLIFYECAGQLYRYHIPTGQKDFFMTLPCSVYRGWKVVSNQTVQFDLNWEDCWYNREEGKYYSSYSDPVFFYVTRGEEGKVPSKISTERTLFSGDEIALRYNALVRRIPGGSYSVGKVTFENLRHGEFTRDDLDILREELHYLGLIDMADSIWDIEQTKESTRLPATTVRDMYESVFGKGSFASLAGKDLNSVTGGYFLYDKETDEYRYVCYSYGGGDAAITGNTVFTKVVEKGGSVELYVRKAIISQGGVLFYPGNTWLVDHYDAPIFAIGKRSSDPESDRQPDKMLENGELDEYLPLYKVTFLANGDGSYAWQSTEMVEEGKPIPESCFEETPLPLGKVSGDAYFAEERQLVTSPFGSFNKFWSKVVLVTEDNVDEWKEKIEDRNPQLGYWIYRKTSYDKTFRWRHLLGEGEFGTFAYYRYYERGGVLFENNLDDQTEIPLGIVGKDVEDIVAFRDLVFYRVGNAIYRCYIPEASLKQVVTIPSGAQWEPVSNRVIRITAGGETYWYDTESGTNMSSYSGPEIREVPVNKLASLDAEHLFVPQAPSAGPEVNIDEPAVSTEQETPASGSDPLPENNGISDASAPVIWPWIMGGAILLVGIGGAVTWFLIRKKK